MVPWIEGKTRTASCLVLKQKSTILLGFKMTPKGSADWLCRIWAYTVFLIHVGVNAVVNMCGNCENPS